MLKVCISRFLYQSTNYHVTYAATLIYVGSKSETSSIFHSMARGNKHAQNYLQSCNLEYSVQMHFRLI